jgi:microcystin-dependent protein
MVPGTSAVVSSSNFLRSDTKSTTNYQLNVLSNDGLRVGNDGNFSLYVDGKDAIIHNASTDGSVDIRNNNVNGRQVSILKVVNQRVGINNVSPQETLDVSGNQRLTGKLVIEDASLASNLTTASVKFAGGLAVSKNIIVGTTLNVVGVTTTSDIVPDTPTSAVQRSLGATGNRWNNVYANTVTAGTFNGTFVGNFTGNAVTANTLRLPTTFTLSGDIESDAISFDGSTGGYTKTFTTSIRSALISEKDSISSTNKGDEFLLYRPGLGLRKTTRDNMVGDLAVPIGALFPFAGTTAPVGYLLCDGSEVEKDRYPELWVAIGGAYGAPTLATNFKLPDLRGRFPLGKDNMDNGAIVAALGGGTTDAGGGRIGRVNTDSAVTLGGTGGQEQQSISVDNLPKAPVTTGSPVPVPYGSGSSVGQTGNSLSVMNPFITLNYIIRSGKQGY